MSNPENGIYLGTLHEDLDLVFFKEFNTFGIFFSDKPINFNSPKWPHKIPLKTAIPCNNPRTWNKHCDETQIIQEVAWNEGYNLDFENNIRPAITEILDSIREVREEILKKKHLESLFIKIKNWKPCKDCKCYKCYRTGECGSSCENSNKQCEPIETVVKTCNYCPVTGHSLCEYQNQCELKS